MKRPYFYLLAVFLWSGCSGSQPGPGAEGTTLRNETQFCAAWAKAACSDAAVAACSSTESSCIGKQEQACEALVPPGYESTHAEDCIDAVGDAYADDTLTLEELEVVLRLGGACSRLIDGGQDEGDDCVESNDCDRVNGFECVIKPGQTLGTCQVPIEVEGGRRCSSPESVCAPDFYCSDTNCDERLLEGEPCDGDMCAAGLRCAVATGAADTTCVPQLELRQACTSDDECASGLCLGSTRRQCVERGTLVFDSSLCDNF